MELTHENWWAPEGIGKTFQVRWRKPFNTESFSKELKRTGALLKSRFEDSLCCLFLSGGIDSEIALKVLMQAGVRLHAVTLKLYMTQQERLVCINAEEVKTATEVVAQARTVYPDTPISHEVRHVHLTSYSTQVSLERIAHDYNTTQPVYALLMHTILELSASRTFAAYFLGSEVNAQKGAEGWSIVFREDEDAGFYRLAARTKQTIITDFFAYTPELVAAYLNIPEHRDVWTDQTPFKLSLVTTKYAALKRELPEYALQSPYKRNGFEGFWVWNSEAQGYFQWCSADTFEPGAVFRLNVQEFLCPSVN